MKKYNTGRLSGFTLIELLVVVLIIGILAGVALPQYQKAVERSKSTEAFTIFSSIEKAVSMKFMESGADFFQGRPENKVVFDALDISFPRTFPSDRVLCTKYYFFMADCNPWHRKCYFTAFRRDIRDARACAFSAIQDIPFRLVLTMNINGENDISCGYRSWSPMGEQMCKNWLKEGSVDSIYQWQN